MTISGNYSFEWEPLAAALDSGLDDLVALHWAEVGRHRDKMPRYCNYDEYQRLEDAGLLRLLICRRRDKIIGYNSLIVTPHLHYWTTRHVNCDAIYVLPRYRRTRAGFALITAAEQVLTTTEWTRFIYHDRSGIELLGPVLRRLGYELADLTYDKMVRSDGRSSGPRGGGIGS